MIVSLLLVGCNSPFSDVKENKQEIETLKQKIDNLEIKTDKIDELEMKLNDISQKQETIQKTINDNQMLSKLVTLKSEVEELKKNIKTKEKLPTFDYIVIHPMTLITIKDTKIYEAPSKTAKVVKTYKKATTFTTYKEKNGFVKVTGYFVKTKWVENNKEWWIPKENTSVKRLAK